MPKVLNRRAVLRGGAAALALRPGHAPAEAARVRTVEDFLDSVGVNTHLSSEPYLSRFDEVAALLKGAGLRHVRDELRPSDDLNRWKALHRVAGVRAHLLVSPVTNSVDQMVDRIRAVGRERISAVEGQNEGDGDWFRAQPAARPTWDAAVVAYQLAVARALRAAFGRAAPPLVSPSVLDWKPDDMALLRPCAPCCDAVAIHSYVQGGQEPETTDDYAGLGWYLRRMRDPFKPGAPVQSTETGYRTLATPGGGGVSEAAAAAYLPRLLLNDFMGGVERTFLYELMDGGTDPAQGEHHWGMVRHDGTPKPAFGAVAALMGALRGLRAGAPASPVAAEPRGAEPELRVLALARPDGGRVYALWRAVRCWDPARAVDITVAPRPQPIALGAVCRVRSLTLGGEAGWAEHGTTDAVTLPLGVGVTLLAPG